MLESWDAGVLESWDTGILGCWASTWYHSTVVGSGRLDREPGPRVTSRMGLQGTPMRGQPARGGVGGREQLGRDTEAGQERSTCP